MYISFAMLSSVGYCWWVPHSGLFASLYTISFFLERATVVCTTGVFVTMAIIDSIKAQFTPPSRAVETGHGIGEGHSIAVGADGEMAEKPGYTVDVVERGVVNVEAVQAVWGKNGKWYIVAG